MKDATLTFFQVVCMLMLTIGLMNHVIVIPVLMDAAKRDAWISPVPAACHLPWILRHVCQLHA